MELHRESPGHSVFPFCWWRAVHDLRCASSQHLQHQLHSTTRRRDPLVRPARAPLSLLKKNPPQPETKSRSNNSNARGIRPKLAVTPPPSLRSSPIRLPTSTTTAL